MDYALRTWPSAQAPGLAQGPGLGPGMARGQGLALRPITDITTSGDGAGGGVGGGMGGEDPRGVPLLTTTLTRPVSKADKARLA